MDLYFKMPLSTIPSIVLLLTTQCVGFGLAGVYRVHVESPSLTYRDAAESPSLRSEHVLAISASNGPTFHDPLSYSRNPFRTIDIPAPGSLEAIPNFPPSIHRHFHLSVLSHASLSNIDEYCDTMPGQQQFVVDEDDGEWV
jgi:hypothetical protein